MAEANLYYLDVGVQNQDVGVLKNLAQMGEKLKELKIAMEARATEAEQAKKANEHYAHVIIPQQMFSAGVESVGLSSGGVIKVKRNFYCQPNKNEADRKTIVEWLRANGGAHLVNHDANVSAEDMQKLEEQNIPFIENTTVNTTSLKAFLKDKIGATTGVQQIAIDTTVEIEV